MSENINGAVPFENRNNPKIQAYLDNIYFENLEIKGSINIVTIDAGNIINPASIGDNPCTTRANIGTA